MYNYHGVHTTHMNRNTNIIYPSLRYTPNIQNFIQPTTTQWYYNNNHYNSQRYSTLGVPLIQTYSTLGLLLLLFIYLTAQKAMYRLFLIKIVLAVAVEFNLKRDDV